MERILKSKEMTNEALNRWAHEFLGECWHEMLLRHPEDSHVQCRCGANWPKNKIEEFSNPDYCSDLNLAAKVEVKTEERKVWRIAYAWNLAEIVCACKISKKNTFIHIDGAGAMAKATAKQRIRACYETMKGDD